MNQLKSIYNHPFKDSHAHPIHTSFPIIVGNGSDSLDSLRNLSNFIRAIHRSIDAVTKCKGGLKENKQIASERGTIMICLERRTGCELTTLYI